MAFRQFINIHWAAPALLFSCFIAAILVSLSHHLYYQSLNGQPVEDESEQRWVSRIGTGLAFIVKLLLTTSSATAFVQWFWFRLLKTPTTLRKADVLYGMIYEPANFLHIKHWVTSLPLAFMATITWTIPLSAVFTPGAIVVQSASLTSVQPITVNAADFASGIYSAVLFDTDSNNRTSQISSTTFAVMVTDYMVETNSIMLVPHENKNTNSSYRVDFHGPSMSCRLTDTVTTDNVNRGARKVALNSGFGIKILSFIPGAGFNESSNTTFYDVLFSPETLPDLIDPISTDISRLYVLFPDKKDGNATLYSCGFYNATYKTDFHLFSDGTQQVNAVIDELTPLVFKDVLHYITLGVNDTAQDALNRTYIGMAAYYGVQVRGLVKSEMITNSSGHPIYSIQNILDTRLAGSPALMSQMYDPDQASKTFAETWPQPGDQEHFIKLYEDLFRNITISAQFGFNRENFDLPQAYFDDYLFNITTNATVSMRQTQYKYTPLDLLLPYGLSVVFAFVCILMGLYAMLMGNASFSNDFSTVLRFVHSMSHLKLKDEKYAAQPLPKHFKDVILEYGKLSPHGNEQTSP